MGTPPAPLRVLMLTPNIAINSTGRTHCLWLLARHLGWRTRIAATVGTQVWLPLRGTGFAADCVLLEPMGGEAAAAELDRLAAEADVIIAVKALPASFGAAQALAARSGLPLLLDVDDPDIEVRTDWLPLVDRVKGRVKDPGGYDRGHRDLRALRQAAVAAPKMVSNPVLQEMYGGGVLVPHVRELPGDAHWSASTTPVIRFVGSPRGHKGIRQLRRAVRRLSGEGFRLEVTDTPPRRPRSWETWLGMTTFEEGQQLVAGADIVAVPSLLRLWAHAQLPAKLIDAMMLGRAVIASDTPPMRWALGEAGILAPPGDVGALTTGLRSLRDPALRRRLGVAASERAAAMFSVGAVAPAFETAVREVLAS